MGVLDELMEACVALHAPELCVFLTQVAGNFPSRRSIPVHYSWWLEECTGG